jgi:hypothetical protein
MAGRSAARSRSLRAKKLYFVETSPKGGPSPEPCDLFLSILSKNPVSIQQLVRKSWSSSAFRCNHRALEHAAAPKAGGK